MPLPSSAGFARQQPMNFDGYFFNTLQEKRNILKHTYKYKAVNISK
jgi:hypothetical protein